MPTKRASKKQRIDWSQRMLVIHKDLGIVIQTRGLHSGAWFSGTVVFQGKSPYEIGFHSDWKKNQFEIYPGAVLLSNYPDHFKVTAVDPNEEKQAKPGE